MDDDIKVREDNNADLFAFLDWIKSHFVIVALPVVLIFFFLFGLMGISVHKNVSEMDTMSYVRTAYDIGAMGIAGCVSQCISGRYTEAGVQPLYPVYISGVIQRDLNSFVAAKKVTFALGFFTVCLFFFTVKKMYGVVPACIGSLILVINATWIRLSTMIASEALLVLLCIAAWCCIVGGFTRPRFFIVAGALTGLAYLTKASALLIVPVFLMTYLIIFRHRLKSLIMNKYFWGFFLAFLIVTAPYLIRNMRVYGKPFYTENAKHFWIDDWQESYVPGFEKNPPAFGDYLRRHSVHGVVEQVAKAVVIRGPRLLVESLEPFPYWQRDSAVQLITNTPLDGGVVIPLCILAFFLYGIYATRRETATILTCVWICLFYVAVSWFSKVGFSPRYFLPVVPFICLYAGRGFAAAGTLFQKRRRDLAPVLENTGYIAFLFFVILSGFALYSQHGWQDIAVAGSYKLPKGFQYVLAWVHQNIDENTRYFSGKNYSSPLFFYEGLERGRREPWPQVPDTAYLKSYIAREGIRYGILDLASFVYRLHVFKEHIVFTKKQGMIPGRQITGFKIAGADPETPRYYIVFEFETDKF